MCFLCFFFNFFFQFHPIILSWLEIWVNIFSYLSSIGLLGSYNLGWGLDRLTWVYSSKFKLIQYIVILIFFFKNIFIIFLVKLLFYHSFVLSLDLQSRLNHSNPHSFFPLENMLSTLKYIFFALKKIDSTHSIAQKIILVLAKWEYFS